MEFIATMAIVLEVFALIAIGYGAAALNLLKPEIGDGLGDFVFLVAVPVLVFRTLAGASFEGPSPWLLWFSFFTAAFVTWFAGGLLTRRVFGRDARASVIGGISSVFGNTVLVGIPVVYSVFGPDGAVPLLLIISIHMPLMMTLSSILIERAEIADGIKQTGTSLVSVFSKVARTLIRNPVIIALFAALLFRQTGLTLSGVPGAIADQLAAAAVPCALFSLGMSLKKYGIRGNLPPALCLSVLKLFAFPALAWFLASTIAGLPPLWTIVVVVTAACPTGVNAYLLANHFRTGHALSANTITITTAAAVLSMGFWLWVLQPPG